MSFVLKPIRGRNTFCGPAAIAALTGLSTDQAAAALRCVSGRKQIRAVTLKEIISVLVMQGATKFRAFPRPENEWVPLEKVAQKLEGLGPCLLSTTSIPDGKEGHVSVVHNGYLADSVHRRKGPIPIEEALNAHGMYRFFSSAVEVRVPEVWLK